MYIRSTISLGAVAIVLAAMPAHAQQAAASPGQEPVAPSASPPAPDQTDEDPSSLKQTADQIVVVAGRIKGEVQAPQAPVLELDEQDIAAYGATSISDLLDQLAPETTSGRGRGSGSPVILLNGQRISSFRELRDFPPEAIRRVEVLPEEVALRFGYPADQRVVNIILKDKFSQRNVGVEYGVPTKGGYHTSEIEGALTKIDNGARLNIKLKYTGSSPLTEAERGLPVPAAATPTVAGDPDPAAYTTLISDAQNYSLNANWAKGLGKNGLGGQISLNGALSRADTLTFNGLNTVVLTAPDGTTTATRTTLSPAPLATVSHVTTAQTGGTLNLPLGAWQFTATADYTHTDTRSRTDRTADLSGLQALAASGALPIDGALPASGIVARPSDSARSNTDAATSLITLTGRPLLLPAGETTLTLNTGYAWSDITSSDTRTTTGGVHLVRGDAQVGGNIGVPITSRRNNFGAGLGDITLNLNAGLHHLSDFGTLYNYGAGLTWGVTEKLTLQASYIAEDQAPGLSDLGGPITVTPGVAVYDFTTGRTVLTTVTTGGNPSLQKEKQRDWKFSATWNLPFFQRSNFIVEYFRNHSSNTTNAFPALTPQVEAAFPGRVVRDANGQIVSVDERPVTFAEERSSSLRYGFNIGGQFGKASADADAEGGGRGGRGGGFGPRGGNGRGRWNLSLYHTVRFDQTAQLTTGGPVLDLLNGDAIAGSGVARHTVTMEGGGFYRGFGLRLSGNYTGGTHINANGLPGSTQLNFAPVATFGARLFVDMNQQKKLTNAVPFFKNSRLMLKVDNLFDAQQKVTDANGQVPLRYLPGYEDPAGRVITIDFRKNF